MLAKRIIACLDVKDGRVVKGVQFRQHEIVGDIVELAEYYSNEGVDELVFYDITASCDERTVDSTWVKQVAEKINIPFCVAGGIRTLQQAENILNAGADKVSINSPALQNPMLINELSRVFGTQCVVIGVDSMFDNDEYYVYQFTGDSSKTVKSRRKTLEWVQEIQDRGAGEIVLNCMSVDGKRDGYDLAHTKAVRKIAKIPLIASGGAGKCEDFYHVFTQANVDGALAASIFHKKLITISKLKNYLMDLMIEVRL